MTNPFLAKFDAIAKRSFRRVGTSDPAIYTPSTGGAGKPCEVLVNRGVEVIGELSKALNMATTITCFASEVGSRPQPGARFLIGSELFTVDELDQRTDESRYVCIVKEGA